MKLNPDDFVMTNEDEQGRITTAMLKTDGLELDDDYQVVSLRPQYLKEMCEMAERIGWEEIRVMYAHDRPFFLCPADREGVGLAISPVVHDEEEADG